MKVMRSLPCPGYSVWNPCGIHGIHQEFHMESMEWMLAETPANFLFHGHHGFHMEWGWNGHGMIHSIWIPHGFHMECIWSPWNKFNSMIIPLECRRNHLIWLPKIVASWRIEHQTPREITWCIHSTLFPYTTLFRSGIGEVFTLSRLFCMESMEWMLAETPANFLFHGHHG